jgi:hypothetical protein
MTLRYRTLKRALIIYGGWEGHTPERFADFAHEQLLVGYDVTRSQDLDLLRYENLSQFDLLLPIWTFGDLTEAQEAGLLKASTEGLGVVAWHGATNSFLKSRQHKFWLGGQFVSHRGGDETEYDVHFVGNDPLITGLEDVRVRSEQYYLLIDPAIQVLATTRIHGHDQTWLSGQEMPVAWKRVWGQGKVFYCALGHTVETLHLLPIKILLQRAVHWAMRKPGEQDMQPLSAYRFNHSSTGTQGQNLL